MALTPVSVSRSVSNKTCHVLSAGLHLLCIYSMVKRLEDMLQWKISFFFKDKNLTLRGDSLNTPDFQMLMQNSTEEACYQYLSSISHN